MKKITFLLLTILTVTTGVAQVHVVNDAFIYSKGTDIFITGDLELRDAPSAVGETGSAFYLREGAETTGANIGDGNGRSAQLIQGSRTAVNSGDGTFSVFQEGLADNFTYNYWSSPVKLQNPPGGVEGFNYEQLYFPTLMETFDFETDFVIDAKQAEYLAVSVRDGITDEQRFDDDSAMDPKDWKDPTVDADLKIARRWLYSYKSADGASEGGGGYFGWKPFQTNSDVVGPGYGFTMKGVKGTSGVNLIQSLSGQFGQRYDFRGIPNNGDISVSVKTDDFSLIGNPYPSAVDLKYFLVDNYCSPGTGGYTGTPCVPMPIIDGELYFWDSNSTTHILVEYEGGYGTYVAGDPDDMDDPGEYVNAAFTTYNSNGIPTGASVGTGGIAAPVGETATRRYAAIGQGFVIQRTSDDLSTTAVEGDFTAVKDGGDPSGSVFFKNEFREFESENRTSSIFKAKPISGADQSADNAPRFVRPKIRLNAFINKQYNRNMVLAFSQSSTTGWDWGLDGSNNANRVATDVYMPIDSRQAIIQTIPESNEETTVPLSFKSAVNNATFEIQVTSFDNFETSQVLIHDKQTNTYHDILNDSFTIQTGKGEVNDRYEIVFQEKSTLGTDDVLATDAFNIFQNNEQSLLSILNPGSKNVSNISVYDLAGRLVSQQNPKDSNDRYTFNTSTYAAGIYIVKVSTRDDEEMAVKVSISN